MSKQAGYASCLQSHIQGGPESFDNDTLGNGFCAVGAKAFSFFRDAPKPFDNVGPDDV